MRHTLWVVVLSVLLAGCGGKDAAPLSGEDRGALEALRRVMESAPNHGRRWPGPIENRLPAEVVGRLKTISTPLLNACEVIDATSYSQDPADGYSNAEQEAAAGLRLALGRGDVAEAEAQAKALLAAQKARR